MAAMSLYSYLGSKEVNSITGEEQYITISRDQEIAIGLQAAPSMAQQYGGLYPDQGLQDFLDDVGFYLVDNSFAIEGNYPFEFHLLADTQIVNAFALPGGQVFMTAALYDRLETEDQVAGVLAHEIVHVLGRHSAQRIAKQELTQGLSGAVVMSSYDPDNPNSQGTAQIAAVIGNLVNMKYGREDELESDYLGVCILYQAGYDPAAMIEVMQILDEATAGGRTLEFFSSHPSPYNRISYIQQAIDNLDSCP
jgi:predicted Zn-dependent protease